MDDDKIEEADIAPDADEPGDDLPEELKTFVVEAPDKPDYIDNPDSPNQGR